jgi:NADP-dependent 3-hydroxy acid dehydrogenase YdfG
MVETNLLGALHATEACLSDLLDGGGDIVNVSSVAGRKARATSSIYSATKWGLNGWSEALRQELQGRDVRVIVIEPGAVDTELPDHITDPDARAAAQRSYGGSVEILTAEDVAEIVTFAVSRPERVALNEILVRPLRQEY